MKNIVVGFDGSQTSERAVAEAADLAKAVGANLHIIKVIDDAALRQGLTSREMGEQERRAAIATTNALLTGKLRGNLKDLPVSTSVEFGSPARSIVDAAADTNAELIVVGNRRVQGLERVLGSVAVEILRLAPCSVYVAHTKQG